MAYNEIISLGAIPMPQDGAEDSGGAIQPVYTAPHLRSDSFQTSGAGGSIIRTSAPATRKPRTPMPVTTTPASPASPQVTPPSPPPTPDAPSPKTDSPNLGEEPQQNTDDNEQGTSNLMKYLPYALGALALGYFFFMRKK